MEMVETETNIVVLNEQPEFSASSEEEVSANYFILCEENAETALSKNVYDFKVAGMSILNWVVRACETQPVILKVSEDDDVLSVIKPHIGEAEYSVVLYANTPLVNKGHLKDLLCYVSRKRMNACKLKKGYVFKNDYISHVDEIYSIDTHDFASNDFYEVKNYDDLSYVQDILSKKVINYHKKNGVYFDNPNFVTIDATTDIGYASTIASGVSILNNSTIANNFKAGVNTTVSNSKIGEDVKIGKGVLIADSVIKDGVIIDHGAVIKGSVIGNNVKVSSCAKIIGSGIKDDAMIQELAQVVNSRLGENVQVGKFSSVFGSSEPTVVMKNSIIGSNVKIVDSKISEASEVPNNITIIENKKVGM